MDHHVLGDGRYLWLVRRKRWEYVERTSPVESAFFGAVTDEGRLVASGGGTGKKRITFQEIQLSKIDACRNAPACRGGH